MVDNRANQPARRPLDRPTSLWIDVDDRYQIHAYPDDPTEWDTAVGRMRMESGKRAGKSDARHPSQPTLHLLDPAREIRILLHHLPDALEAVNDRRVVSAPEGVADLDELHAE